MPIKTIGKFEVKYLSILDQHGKCDEKLRPKLRPNEIKRFFLWNEIALALSYAYSGHRITLMAFNPDEKKAKSMLELIVSQVELPENHHL